MSEVNELERLRARVSELEAQLASERQTAPRRVTKSERSRWWAASSSILLVLACLLAPLSVASVWAGEVLSNTDRYVETVEPLAHDPAVQTAVADEVSTAVLGYLDVKGVATDLLDRLAAQPNVPPRLAAALPGLAAPISSGVESFTRTQVGKLVQTDQFATLWDNVNRVAHEQVVNLLVGKQGGVVSAQADTITLNLAPIIAAVKDRLVQQGFGLANNIPTIDRSFVLVQSDAVTKAQKFYQLLAALGIWLPIATLIFFIAGVAMARDRRLAILRGALGVAGAMVALGVGLAIFRTWYIESTPADVLTPEGAGDVFETLVRFLRTSLRTVGVLALVLALGAFLAGPSRAATGTRRIFAQGVGSARAGAEAAGWDIGPVGAWTYAHKRALRIGVVLAAALAFMFWDHPTAWVVVILGLGALLLVAIIEFLGRPPVGLPAAANETAGPVSAAGSDREPTLPLPSQRIGSSRGQSTSRNETAEIEVGAGASPRSGG